MYTVYAFSISSGHVHMKAWKYEHTWKSFNLPYLLKRIIEVPVRTYRCLRFRLVLFRKTENANKIKVCCEFIKYLFQFWIKWLCMPYTVVIFWHTFILLTSQV